MIYELKKINLWSLLKISFLINLIVGVIIGLFSSVFFMIMFSLPGQIDPYGLGNSGFNPAAFGILGGLLVGLIYAFIFIVMNGIIAPLITAGLYNLIAGWIGGVKIELAGAGGGDNLARVSTQTPQQPEDSTGGNTLNV